MPSDTPVRDLVTIIGSPRRSLYRGSIENALQSLGASRPRLRDMSTLGDPIALSFFPMSAVEETKRPETRSINAVETTCVHCDFVRL